MRIILASKSPRRRELLAKLFPEFEIITEETDERIEGVTDVKEVTRTLAKRKGEAVLCALRATDACGADECLIISSDTLVEMGGVPFGKPRDEADACAMLRKLSGNRHNVHTGVAVHYGGKCLSETDSTAVYFKELSDGEISEYVAGGEPMDKAGAYGIQGEGGKFVRRIEGDFDTVVGLSLRLTEELVKEILKQ